MAVKVCIWNIQDYGKGKGRGTFADISYWYWAGNSEIRNRFIRDFVVANAVDVLIVLEVGAASKPSLDDLRTKLNEAHPLEPDWRSSFCGSAIKVDNNPPQAKGNIGFKSDGRYEGYAVLWRGAQARFSVLEGLHDIAEDTQPPPPQPPSPRPPLNMVTRGRPAENVRVTVNRKRRGMEYEAEVEMFQPTGGFMANNQNPDGQYPFRNGLRMGAWPPLDLPATGKYGLFGYKNTRRPVYIVLKLAGGASPGKQLCPVIAYHAPSHAVRASYGALISGLGRELYVTDDAVGNQPAPSNRVIPERVICGGDYNYVVTNDQWARGDSFYWTYVNAGSIAWSGGAACQAAPSPAGPESQRNTNVRLVKGRDHDIPITDNNVDAYLHKPLDLVFTRGHGVTGERVDVISGLTVANGHYKDSIQGLAAHLWQGAQYIGTPAGASAFRLNPAIGPERKVRYRRNDYWRAVYTGNWGAKLQSWGDFTRDLACGQMTEFRRAAELYQMFISDHLPLIATIN